MKDTPAARTDDAQICGVLERVRAHSPFLALQLNRYPELADCLATGDIAEALSKTREVSADIGVGATLRHQRSRLALALAVGDIAGSLTLEQVVTALSDFADEALDRALAAVIAARTPEAEPRGFTVIAMGKHGSRELNYSSDIDLIFLYDPATLPLKPREDPAQAAVRIGQKLVEMLQARDGNGYVFRVDLRLRPSPEVTPTALPVEAAISYYESSALPWERAAFIRARVAAGDQELGRYFLDAIHPFVWRRSLDFGAIQEIQSISSRIRDHYAQGQIFGPGYDLKRGRGGIREIEFFAQIHQLIHGGREPQLRVPATMGALQSLAQAGRIPSDEAEDLSSAYRLLRTIEHRLQMVDDKQTHSLPQDGAALDNVSRLHGLDNGEALIGHLAPHVERVARVYDRLAAQSDGHVPSDPSGLEGWLADAGFPEPVAARQRVETWRSGKVRSLRTPAAMDAFEAMLPALLEALGGTPAAMDAMNRFDDIVCKIPSAVNFFRLLEARPALTHVLAEILGHAPALSEVLARRPQLLDGLIDASAFEPVGSVEQLCADFSREERADEDYQLLLDRVRRKVNERRFALGAQLVVGASDPLDAAAGYARVAEASVQLLATAAIREFEAVHGRVPGCDLVILGLGRLGGSELTHASDLDLIYLFSGTHEAESNGAKPLRANDYFNRLAPRITAALSVPTAAGPLYEVDTRLRPSGREGMLAVSVEAFRTYQLEQAWTWEHMALTRARPVFGSDRGRAGLAAVIDEALHLSRDPKKVTADAAKMRRDIATHKPPSGPFDIKLGEGGLVDLEFSVQTLQLRNRTAFYPNLSHAIGALSAAGLIDDGVEEAHKLLTRMLVIFRLVSPSSAEPAPATRPLVARACGHESWESLLAAHAAARQKLRDLWHNVSEGA